MIDNFHLNIYRALLGTTYQIGKRSDPLSVVKLPVRAMPPLFVNWFRAKQDTNLRGSEYERLVDEPQDSAEPQPSEPETDQEQQQILVEPEMRTRDIVAEWAIFISTAVRYSLA
jgi:hypothetical protein